MLALSLALLLAQPGPADPAGDFRAALAAEQAGDGARADALLDRACAEAPRWALPKVELAQRALAQGNAKKARELAGQATVLEPDNPRAFHLLSQAAEATGDLAAAAAADQKALALRPGYGEAEDHLGRVLWNAGKRDDAIAVYLRIAAERPNDAPALAVLASAEEEDGRLAQAEQALRTLCEIDPRNPGWHRRLARLLDREGQGAAAAQEAAKADKLAGERRQARHLRPLLPSRR